MGKDNSISMPGGFGGLMRYNEEYDSKIKFKPEHIIIFIILIIFLTFALKILFPIKVA
jgi:preprotein translocase subunit Sec61beta